MKRLLMAAAALVCAGVAIAGPNAGGTLILAANPALIYTIDATTYCGQSGLTDCAAAINAVPGADPTVFFAIAAFATGTSPRLAGITFGIQYDASVVLLGRGPCADFELATSDWPNSGSGTALTWNTAQTGLLTDVYWFAGYNYGSPTGHICLIPHPTQGAMFADDATPANLDPIAGLGCLGFDAPGSTPCPSGVPVTGACCLPNFTCQELTVDQCMQGGGAYMGDGSTCNPNPCPPPPPPTGACCINGVCFVLTQDDCGAQGGSYQGDNIPCDPNTCVPPVPVEKSTWGVVKNKFGK